MPHSKCSCHSSKTEVVKNEKTGRGLLAKNVPASKPLGLSETVATKLALDALENYSTPDLSLPKCQVHKRDYHWSPYHLFETLDTSLFRGVLKDQIYLRWETFAPEIHGITFKPGVRDTRITIELNSFLAYEENVPFLIPFLIHHMVHAYFLVCCDAQGNDQADNHSLQHGLGFSTLIYRIREVCRAQGTRAVRTSSMPSRPCAYRNPVRADRHIKRAAQSKGWSYCLWYGDDGLDKVLCRAHMSTLDEMKLHDGKDGKPTPELYPKSHYLHTAQVDKASFVPVLRTRYPASLEGYVELHFANFAVPFPRSKLTPFESISSNIPQGNVSINVPAPSNHLFFAFYSFLLNEDYPPELVRVSTPYLTTTTARGPPSIATFHPNTPAYLVNDIQMFVLGSRMAFDELKEKALERLYSMSETHNDPMAVLEEIYNEADLEKEEHKNTLRNWARAFLAKKIEKSGETNILILQKSEQWKDRFMGLRKKNQLFNKDCSETEDDLLLNKALEALEKGEKKDQDGEDGKKDDTKQLGGLTPRELESLCQCFPEIFNQLVEQCEAEKRAKDEKEKRKKEKEKQDQDEKAEAKEKDKEEKPLSCAHQCSHYHTSPSPAFHGQEHPYVSHDLYCCPHGLDSGAYLYPAQIPAVYGRPRTPCYPIPPHY
ncbi:hypothetical protein DIZ76_016758 [Coccidioides immitis]|nr:hypothetical protein DIZ76_016758 [Coccidioides immitis]